MAARRVATKLLPALRPFVFIVVVVTVVVVVSLAVAAAAFVDC
jgi:hypothetical protein